MLPREMTAAVFQSPKSITIESVPINQTSDGSVTLKILSCAVCGYDVRVYNQGHTKVHPPIILGHEICAETLQPLNGGGNSTPIPEGTRVAISPLVPCLKCYYCLNGKFNLCNDLSEIGSSINGGFAEYIKIPRNNLLIEGIVPVPENISDEEAALIEPLACCLNAHSKFRSTAENNYVIIIGDGPIGMFHLQISKLFGAKTFLIGKIPSRIELAKQLGADQTFVNKSMEGSVCDLMSSTQNIGGSTVVVATSSSDALDLALKIASKDSVIILFAGMPKSKILKLNPNWLHYNQISLYGSFSATPNIMKEAVSLVSQNKISLRKIISNKFALKDIHEAFFATEKYCGFRSIVQPTI
jgi:L-iditol 2-dehydrogenase